MSGGHLGPMDTETVKVIKSGPKKESEDNNA